MKGLFKILVIILIVLLSLPGIQQLTNIPKMKPLHGVIEEQKVVDFTFTNYLNFDYQLSVLKYIDQNFGFRPFFIRLYNQVQFSFFNQSQGDAVIVGKDDYLYEDWFIREGLGYHNVSWEKISSNVKKLSTIRKFLQQYDAELLVILAPGKNYYFPEYIPDHYIKIADQSNYSRYSHYLRESNVPTFDANGWFMDMKGNEEAPLFPKTGTHWSYYGADICADSILTISEKLLKRDLNNFTIDSLQWSDVPLRDDKDLENLSNLFFPIEPIPHAYTVLKHDTTHKKEDQPSMVAIGDSFFWHLWGENLNHSFKNIWYWYYYKSIYPTNKYKTVKDLDVSLQLKNTDLVVILTTTAGLFQFGYGVIDDAYEFAMEDKLLRDATIQELTNEILASQKTVDSLNLVSKENNISLDSAIQIEASNRARVKLKALFSQPDYPLK